MISNHVEIAYAFSITQHRITVAETKTICKQTNKHTKTICKLEELIVQCGEVDIHLIKDISHLLTSFPCNLLFFNIILYLLPRKYNLEIENQQRQLKKNLSPGLIIYFIHTIQCLNKYIDLSFKFNYCVRYPLMANHDDVLYHKKCSSNVKCINDVQLIPRLYFYSHAK